MNTELIENLEKEINENLVLLRSYDEINEEYEKVEKKVSKQMKQLDMLRTYQENELKRTVQDKDKEERKEFESEKFELEKSKFKFEKKKFFTDVILRAGIIIVPATVGLIGLGVYTHQLNKVLKLEYIDHGILPSHGRSLLEKIGKFKV